MYWWYNTGDFENSRNSILIILLVMFGPVYFSNHLIKITVRVGALDFDILPTELKECIFKVFKNRNLSQQQLYLKCIRDLIWSRDLAAKTERYLHSSPSLSHLLSCLWNAGFLGSRISVRESHVWFEKHVGWMADAKNPITWSHVMNYLLMLDIIVIWEPYETYLYST